MLFGWSIVKLYARDMHAALQPQEVDQSSIYIRLRCLAYLVFLARRIKNLPRRVARSSIALTTQTRARRLIIEYIPGNFPKDSPYIFRFY